jgi:hypothetical protein
MVFQRQRGQAGDSLPSHWRERTGPPPVFIAILLVVLDILFPSPASVSYSIQGDTHNLTA